ncbi:MAG: MarR family transcriptional regulator, partial [Planctomycetota bacterium]|nr:MarR family transcriptional regulator [Planctomycetota bacterium]
QDGETTLHERLILGFFVIHNMAMRLGDRLTAPIGLTSSRWMLLCAIGDTDEPRTITELSDDAMISVQNVSRMVAAMEREGLVRRFSKKGAGRALFVRLTPEGERAMEATRALGDRFHSEMLEGVSDEEVESLRSMLGRLIGNLERFESTLAAECEGQSKRSG